MVAFNTLKECLTSAPFLPMLNHVGDFMVYTDASLEGIREVLMQDVQVIMLEETQGP